MALPPIDQLPPAAAMTVEELPEKGLKEKLDPPLANIPINNPNTTGKTFRPPKIEAADNAAWTAEELEAVKNQVKHSEKEKVVIFIVPTRGKHPDIPLEEFSNYLIESVTDANCYPIMIYGVNHRNNLKNEMPELLPPDPSKLFVKVAPFTWFEEDRRDQVLPFGQMRNFCLEQAKKVWEALTEGNSPVRQKDSLLLFSMDGDTQLTPASFQHMLRVTTAPDFPLVLATGGYDLAPTAPEWSKRSNQISMTINSRCFTKLDKIVFYYGYLAEPLIALNSLLVQKLFEQDRKSSFFQMRNEEEAPFGFWDLEGRRLHRYLRKLTNDKLHSLGPPQKNQPLLKNYDRFTTTQAPSFSLPEVKTKYKFQKLSPTSFKLPKQQLTSFKLQKQQLAEVITKLFCQAQHSIQPRVMGSNIASYYALPPNPVRSFAAYFYSKTILNLLNLGPSRGVQFAKKIRLLYDENLQFEYSSEDEKTFGVKKEGFHKFLRKNFFENQKDLQDKNSQSRKNFIKSSMLLSDWMYTVFQTLGEQFGATYAEELEGEEAYIPMAMPENYPRDAEKLLSEDETLLNKVPLETFDRVTEKLKKHNFKPLEKDDELKDYQQIKKIGSIFKHQLVVFLLNQSSQDVNEQQELCKSTLEKVKQTYESVNELAISLSASDGEIKIHFAQLNENRELQYSDFWTNEKGLSFESNEFHLQ